MAERIVSIDITHLVRAALEREQASDDRADTAADEDPPGAAER